MEKLKRQQLSLNTLLPIQSPSNGFESPKSISDQQSYFMSPKMLSIRTGHNTFRQIDNSTSYNQSTKLDETHFDNFIYQDNIYNIKLTQKQLKDSLQKQVKLYENNFLSHSPSNESFNLNALLRRQTDTQMKSSKDIPLSQKVIKANNRSIFESFEQKNKNLPQNNRNQTTTITQNSPCVKIAKNNYQLYKEACEKRFTLEKEQFSSYIHNEIDTVNPTVRQISMQKLRQLNEKQLGQLSNKLKTLQSKSPRNTLDTKEENSEQNEESEEIQIEDLSNINYIDEMKKELGKAGAIGRHDSFLEKQAQEQKHMLKQIQENYQKKQDIFEEQRKREIELKKQQPFRAATHNKSNSLLFNKENNSASNMLNTLRNINNMSLKQDRYLNKNRQNVTFIKKQQDEFNKEQLLEQMRPDLFRKYMGKYNHLKIRNVSYLIKPLQESISTKDLKIQKNLIYHNQLNNTKSAYFPQEELLLNGVNKCEEMAESKIQIKLNQQLTQTKQKFKLSMKQKEEKLFKAIQNNDMIEKGDTPLIHSVKHSSAKIIYEMLEKGSHIQTSNMAGQTAISQARKQQRFSIAEVLEQREQGQQIK